MKTLSCVSLWNCMVLFLLHNNNDGTLLLPRVEAFGSISSIRPIIRTTKPCGVSFENHPQRTTRRARRRNTSILHWKNPFRNRKDEVATGSQSDDDATAQVIAGGADDDNSSSSSVIEKETTTAQVIADQYGRASAQQQQQQQQDEVGTGSSSGKDDDNTSSVIQTTAQVTAEESQQHPQQEPPNEEEEEDPQQPKKEGEITAQAIADESQQQQQPPTKEEDRSVPQRQPKKEEETVAKEAIAASQQEQEPQQPPRKEENKNDPVAKARELRAQAERMRLEAERMDAELTLEKIAKLEQQLAAATANKEKNDNVEDLQREMENLQAKMRGETPKPIVATKAKKEETSSSLPTKETESITTTAERPKISISVKGLGGDNDDGGVTKSFLQKDFDGLLKDLNEGPAFLKNIMANMVEMEDFDDPSDINTTELALRIQKMQKNDFSYSKLPPPTFTAEQIEKAKQDLKGDWLKRAMISRSDDQEEANAASNNETALALMALEYDYYTTQGGQLTSDDKFVEDWVSTFSEGLADALNQTSVDRYIESLFPKCTRKENVAEPTETQIQTLISDVLPKASWSTNGKPEKVMGGYIVRGSSKSENGNDLIDAIYKELDKKPQLADQLTIVYTKDFTIFSRIEEEAANDDLFQVVAFDPDSEAPILYVLAKDITREPRRIALSTVSFFGVATCWYLSIYPFLINPGIMKRVEEQVDLANAGLDYDLSWLSEYSLPLFLTFIGIQLLHEISHKVVSSIYGFKTTVPVFVPSLITGITASVTTFKTPPKNKEEMFDFSLVGPLCGMLASCAALFVGSQMTVYSTAAEAANLPALPLEILRQSTLGGGIIDAVLGNGALNVPDAARGSQAIAEMTVPLHPVAIAGYIGLIVNSLSLLPIGTTDGGRVALTLFGRGAKLVVGNVFLLTLLFIGLVGSDLFLFYFAFIIAFQTGNEIPSKNEVDDVSFSRVIVAIIAYLIGALALVPFQ